MRIKCIQIVEDIRGHETWINLIVNAYWFSTNTGRY